MLRIVFASLFLSAPAFADGAYYLCDLFNGQVSGGCGSWYQGKAVVWVEERAAAPAKKPKKR